MALTLILSHGGIVVGSVLLSMSEKDIVCPKKSESKIVLGQENILSKNILLAKNVIEEAVAELCQAQTSLS